MSQTFKKRTVWKTVSWAAEIADVSGIDYDDLELDSDEELDEDDYYDPADDYEEPATRGKSGRSSWNMNTPRQPTRDRDEPRGRSRATDRDQKLDEETTVDAQKRIEVDLKRDELRKIMAAMNLRVIEVRHGAPAVPPAVGFLVETYQALDKLVSGQADTMDMVEMSRVEDRAAAFNKRLDALEKMFTAHPDADNAAVWANESKDKKAKPSLDKLVAAIQADPPNEPDYAAACKELEPLYAPVAKVEKARIAYQAAYEKLDYFGCLTMANTKETADLEKAKGEIDKQRAANTEKGYIEAAKLVPGLARMIVAVAKAYNERAEKKPELEGQFKTCKAGFTASLLALNGWRSPKKEEWKDARAKLGKQLDTLLSAKPKDFDAKATEGLLNSLNEIIETINQQADTNRAKEQLRLETINAAADKLEYAQFKFNDNSTWVMQALVADKIPLVGVLIANNSDQAKVDAIVSGTLGEGTCQTGMPYHCHMIYDGSGGISFAYNHLGGRRVQPVIYDYSTHRINDKYDWEISRRKKSPAAASLPGWIATRRAPKT